MEKSNSTIYISEYIVPMNKFGNIGKIHSLFERSFNIEVGGHLINVASYQEYLSSYGVFLPDEMFQALAPFLKSGNVVKLSAAQLVVYSEGGVKAIDLRQAIRFSLAVGPISVEDDVLDGVIQLLEEKNLQDQLGLTVGEQEEHLFQGLAEGLPEGEWPEVVSYLIGRGKGLTPSGDDLLLAYLFTLKLFAPDQAFHLASALASAELSTTSISQNYIEALLAGYVSSPIYHLFLAFKNKDTLKQLSEAVDRLTKIGHTSGKDMSFGLLLGLRAIRYAHCQ